MYISKLKKPYLFSLFFSAIFFSSIIQPALSLEQEDTAKPALSKVNENGNANTPVNWYDNFLFQDPGFVFEFIRTLGSASMGGAELGESVATARKIPNGDTMAWYQEWLNTANRINNLANEMQGAGHKVSASEFYFRACNYFRTAGFYAVSPEERPKAVSTWEQSRNAFQNAIKNMPNAEFIRIPYENTTLPAYYFKASNKSNPLFIIMTGFDGTAEELYFEMGVSALKRGYNVLMFEGPGQGEMIFKQNIPFRPDWEVVMKSVLDYVEKMPEINQNQIGFIGYSMGGYFAPRACAFESRIKACIADGGVLDLYQSVLNKYPQDVRDLVDKNPEKFNQISRDTMKNNVTVAWFFNNGMWRFHANTPAELVQKLKDYTLKDVANKIKMPTLIIESEADTLLPGNAKQLYDLIQGPKTFRLFTREETAEGHCQEGALSFANAVILNWLDDTFKRTP